MYRIGNFFGVAKISSIFWGCLILLIFFLRKTVDAGSKPMNEEKMRVPHSPWDVKHQHTQNISLSANIVCICIGQDGNF